MENSRTKQLLPLQTVIGAINLNIKGKMQTFNVLYSGAMLPWVDGKMLFVPEKRYNAMLRDFFVNEGKEYIIPSVTQIAQDRANVINAYTEGRLGGMYAEKQDETQQVAEEYNNEQETQEEQAQKEQEEQSEELAEGDSESYESEEGYNEPVSEESKDDEQEELSEESDQDANDSDEADEPEESELEEEEIQNSDANQQEQEQEKEIEVEEIDDDDLLNFSVDGQREHEEADGEENSINEMRGFMVDDVPTRETRTARYAQRIAEYSFNDESLNDLKEIIRDQNKIMMHQNEIIMNLNDAVVKQQEAIDVFKGKINNANLFVKSNQKKNYIAMIICLLITIATVVGMQLYAPKMESAIQLDPNTDAEVHIVIHNDDGTDSFERIGTITITDGKLTVGE